MRRLAFAALLVVLAACTSLPPLEDWERFKVTARRGEKPTECVVRVQATGGPPPPIGHYIHGLVQLVEGRVELEIKGWGKPDAPGQEEMALEVKSGVAHAGDSFTFVLLLRGHRDEYTITLPEKGDPVVEPPKREFSERG